MWSWCLELDSALEKVATMKSLWAGLTLEQSLAQASALRLQGTHARAPVLKTLQYYQMLRDLELAPAWKVEQVDAAKKNPRITQGCLGQAVERRVEWEKALEEVAREKQLKEEMLGESGTWFMKKQLEERQAQEESSGGSGLGAVEAGVKEPRDTRHYYNMLSRRKLAPA
jgi:hypothetical protein